MSNPKPILAGAAAAPGVFGCLYDCAGSLVLEPKSRLPYRYYPEGAADGPTAIFLGSKLVRSAGKARARAARGARAIAVCADAQHEHWYPAIQPPLMRLLRQRKSALCARETTARPGGAETERIRFPTRITLLLTSHRFHVRVSRLLGMLFFGNPLKGIRQATYRLAKTAGAVQRTISWSCCSRTGL